MGRVKSSVSAQPERGGYGQNKELSIGSARAGATGRVKSSVSAQPERGLRAE